MVNQAIGTQMEIKLRYFGSIRAQLQRERESLQLDPPATVAQVVQLLRARSSKWDTTLGIDNLLTAVNLEFCGLEQQLADQDELALMPPVTGG